MTAEEILRQNEEDFFKQNQIITNVTGKKTPLKSSKKLKSLGAMGFITAMIVIFAVLFSSGNIIPSAISDRLIEETDVQYADAVESKKIVFQQALKSGEIPENTAEILKTNGVLVGVLENDKFIEKTKTKGELSLKIGDQIISADDFINAINSDINLYNAFNEATYSRAAYYFDDSAKEVFKKIGTSRNNYTAESDFDMVMSEIMGEGSDIEVNSVVANKKDDKVYYSEVGNRANSKGEVSKFVDAVKDKNRAGSVDEATLNSADALKVADTTAKEQRSSLFFLGFMENISKMKAGEGNDSKINEAMNFLTRNEESGVVDVKTGEVIKSTGSMLDSPSLYAILSDYKPENEKIKNYSSDRVLNTVENKLNKNGTSAIKTTVSSVTDKVKGLVGRLVNNGDAGASAEIINSVKPTIDSSLFNNSYKTIKGINAGEYLVEGAVNVGKELAKTSGATAGDNTAVLAYSRLNNKVLAMDAEVDKLNRSPFDITSKNTFLGSLVYKYAIANRNNSSIVDMVKKSIASLASPVFAEDDNSYLASFGDCETLGSIGAVGSAQCSEIATFDTSTLNNPFNDKGFVEFVNNNTTLSSSGTRSIKDGSKLAKFIIYNNERSTPLGVVDGGILDSINSGSNSVSVSSSIVEMIKNFLGASDNNKKYATGEVFLNSSNNPDWQTYKYAQRYVSLARATSALKSYSNNSTAYNNIKYFEGENNPVIAFIERYYKIAKNQ